MVNLFDSFKKIEPADVAVVGDFVLDTYVLGDVSRISPEAPVPVLHVKEIKDIPGMAGNVALNCACLGSKVHIVGRLGQDLQGLKFIEYLQSEGIETAGVFFQKGYPTPVKQRMIASSQQLLRVDTEEVNPTSLEIEDEVILYLEKLAEKVKVFAVSDYKKGFLTKKILNHLFELGKKKNIPVIVDPKGQDFTKYQGCTLIKPNLSEAYAAASQSKDKPLDEIASILLEQTKARHLLITKSEQGISLYSKDQNPSHYPVKCQQVKDVTGAGDTVLAMMAVALASDLSAEEGALLSNVAASLVIQKLGCSRVSLAEIAQALLFKDHQQKVFTKEQMSALHLILDKTPFYLVGLEKGQTFNPHMFYAIKELSSSNPIGKIVIYIESHGNNQQLISILSSLQEIDFIAMHDTHLVAAMKKLKPLKTFHIHQDRLKELNDPANLLEQLLTQKVR